MCADSLYIHIQTSTHDYHIHQIKESRDVVAPFEEFNRQIELRQALKRLGFMKEVLST